MRKLIPTILETRQLPDFNYLELDKIIVPVTADDFAAAILHITSAKVVGFDTESRPTFEKGTVSDGPHVVQLKKQGYRNTVGIRAAVAIVFNEQFHKSKHVTMSNWSCPTLSNNQLLYAANDAFAALRVYLQLLNNPKEIAG